MNKILVLILVNLFSTLSFAQNLRDNNAENICSDNIIQQKLSLDSLKKESKELRESMIGLSWLPDDYVIDYSLRSRALIEEIEDTIYMLQKCEKENDENCKKLIIDNCKLIKISTSYFNHTKETINEFKSGKCSSNCYESYLNRIENYDPSRLTK